MTREFAGCDLVLVEGYKALPFPRIEVTRSGIAGVAVEGIDARVTNLPSSDGVPVLPFGDDDRLLETVLRLAGLRRAPA